MINRVVLVGRLTKDLELRKTNSGLSVVSFTVACNRRTSGNNQERQADFINCVAWRQSAEFLAKYAKKGALVGVEGRIQTSSYDGKDGNKVYRTEVIADNVQLLESRSTTEARSSGEGSDRGYNTSGYEPDTNASDDSLDDLQTDSTLDISSDDLPF